MIKKCVKIGFNFKKPLISLFSFGLISSYYINNYKVLYNRSNENDIIEIQDQTNKTKTQLTSKQNSNKDDNELNDLNHDILDSNENVLIVIDDTIKDSIDNNKNNDLNTKLQADIDNIIGVTPNSISNTLVHKKIIEIKDKYKDIKEIRLSKEKAIEILKKLNYNIDKKDYSIILLNKYSDNAAYTKEEFADLGLEFKFFDSLNKLIKIDSLNNIDDNDFVIYCLLENNNSYDLKNLCKKLSNVHIFNKSFYYNEINNNDNSKVEHKDDSNLNNNEINSFNKNVLNNKEGIYLIRRKRFKELHEKKSIIINNEDFVITNLTDKLSKQDIKEALKSSNRAISLLQDQVIKNKEMLYTYYNVTIGLGNIIEFFGELYRDVPYYMFITNTSVQENVDKFNSFVDLLYKYNIDTNYHLILIDHMDYSENNVLVKTFKDKYIKTDFESYKIIDKDIEHFKPLITKKIILQEKSDDYIPFNENKSFSNLMTNKNIINLIKSQDIIKNDNNHKTNADENNNNNNNNNTYNNLFYNSLVNKTFISNNIQMIDADILNNYVARNKKYIIYVKNSLNEFNLSATNIFSQLADNRNNLNENTEYLMLTNSFENMKTINSLYNKLNKNTNTDNNSNNIIDNLKTNYLREKAPYIFLLDNNNMKLIDQRYYFIDLEPTDNKYLDNLENYIFQKI